MDAKSGLMEKISQVLTRLIVENEMSEGMGMGREVGACRLKGGHVGRRSGQFKMMSWTLLDRSMGSMMRKPLRVVLNVRELEMG